MQRLVIGVAVLFVCFMAVPSRGAVIVDQGFETDISGWDVFGGAYDAARTASGTDGITSNSGSYHAKVTSGATNWGGYNSVFPADGYTTSLAIYLDVDAGAANDTRFDFSSAINGVTGSHRRDFVFNGGFYDDDDGPGAGANRFTFSASNNAGRGNSYPKNPGRDPFAIDQTGWYTFLFNFYDSGAGILAVDLSILDALDTVLKTWTLSDPTDVIGTTVGGNRYGWFATNEFDFLAIDNSRRANTEGAVVPEPASMLVWGLLATVCVPFAWRRLHRR